MILNDIRLNPAAQHGAGTAISFSAYNLGASQTQTLAKKIGKHDERVDTPNFVRLAVDVDQDVVTHGRHVCGEGTTNGCVCIFVIIVQGIRF